MHKYAREIAEKVKDKVSAIGIDNLNDSEICELEKWSRICEKIAEMDYYCKIVDAMEESEYGVDYDERGRLYYPRRYKLSSKDYHEKMPQEMRDMDRAEGRMYYTEPNDPTPISQGRFDKARGMYMQHKDVEHMDKAMTQLGLELKEMLEGATAEDRTVAKQKLMNLANNM